MPLVPSRNLVAAAQKGGYAVPAFNTENMEMTQGIIAAAEASSSPVILQTTPTTASYIGLDVAFSMTNSLASRAAVPVALHLDHGDSFELAVKAIRAGFTSIMFDGSKMPLPENIAATASIKRMTSPLNLTLEGEIGSIGGKEDGHEAVESYPSPGEVLEFAEKAGVDMLAVAIGTAHGFYKSEPKLNFELLRQVRKIVSIPLVLHGSSGLSEAVIHEAIQCGMSKINFATELRVAFTECMRECLKKEDLYDPKKCLGPGREAVKNLCLEKITLCASAGKA